MMRRTALPPLLVLLALLGACTSGAGEATPTATAGPTVLEPTTDPPTEATTEPAEIPVDASTSDAAPAEDTAAPETTAEATATATSDTAVAPTASAPEGTAEGLADFACELLDAEAVAAVVGGPVTPGPTIGGQTFNDLMFETRGCQYALNDETGSYEVEVAFSDSDPDLFATLQASQQDDEDYQELDIANFAAFQLDAAGTGNNVQLFVDVEGVAILKVASDLDQAPEDVATVLAELARTAVAAVSPS